MSGKKQRRIERLSKTLSAILSAPNTGKLTRRQRARIRARGGLGFNQGASPTTKDVSK